MSKRSVQVMVLQEVDQCVEVVVVEAEASLEVRQEAEDPSGTEDEGSLRAEEVEEEWPTVLGEGIVGVIPI